MVHIVNFWLKEEYNNPETRAAFEQGLQAICDIPIATQANWGTPAAVKERPVVDSSWDYNIVANFNSVADHDTYQVHEVHEKFLSDFRHLWEKVYILDSELQG